MKEGWNYGTLDDAVNKGSSNISLNKIKEEEGIYPVYGAKGFVKNVSFYQQETNYLALIKDGAGIGRVSKHPAKSSILATMQYIIPKEEYDIDFVRYFLEGLNFEDYRTGSTIPHIYYKDYKNARFPLVEISEQKEVVAILDKAFESIDKAKANIEKNIQNAKELLESFKEDLFKKYSQNSLVEFEKIVKLTRGHNPPKKDFIYKPKDGYVRFYQIRDGWSDKHKVFVPDTKKLHRVKEDEMLMVAYRHIGKVFRGVNGAFNVALCKITNIDVKQLNNDYLFELIPSSYVKGELLKISERSLIPSMSVKELAKLKVPMPSIEKQNEIVKLMKSINDFSSSVLKSYNTKLSSLEELKKSILQKAFNGELKSKEVAA